MALWGSTLLLVITLAAMKEWTAMAQSGGESAVCVLDCFQLQLSR